MFLTLYLSFMSHPAASAAVASDPSLWGLCPVEVVVPLPPFPLSPSPPPPGLSFLTCPSPPRLVLDFLPEKRAPVRVPSRSWNG